MRVRRVSDRPIGASMTPRGASKRPQTSARYRRSTSRWASAATSTSYAGAERATSMSPLVSRSRRCTMPGRAGSPTPDSSGKRCRSPFTSVPPGCPAPGCTTSPAGLLTTITLSSAKRTSTGTGSGPGGWSGAGSESSSTSAPDSRRWLFATGCPPTSTAPSSMSLATSARLQPVRSASARSSRSPASVAGTASSLTPGDSCGVVPVSAVPPSPEQEEHGADRDRRVGDVEARERAHAYEVDHLAAQEARRPEHAVGEVAQRTAEHQREGDHHDRILRSLRDANEHDGDDGREHREHRRETGQETERATGIAAQPQLDGVADDREGLVGKPLDDQRLRDLIEQDDADDEPENQERSTRRPGGTPLGVRAPASGVVRHEPCSRHTPRRTGSPRDARPRGGGRRARTPRTSRRPSASLPGRSHRRSGGQTPTAAGPARARH